MAAIAKSQNTQKARPIIRARLILLLCAGLLGGVIGLQGTDYLLSLERQSLSVQAEVTRVLTAAPDETAGKINVNLAAAEDFLLADGVGPALAQAIVDYRVSQGGFYFLEELKDVPGIGDKRLEALREWFYCPAD